MHRFALDRWLGGEYRHLYEVSLLLILSKTHLLLFYTPSNSVWTHEQLRRSLKRKLFGHWDLLDVKPYCINKDVLPILRSYTPKSFLHPRFQHMRVYCLKLHRHWLHIIVPELLGELIMYAHQWGFFWGDLSKSFHGHWSVKQPLLQSK